MLWTNNKYVMDKFQGNVREMLVNCLGACQGHVSDIQGYDKDILGTYQGRLTDMFGTLLETL